MLKQILKDMYVDPEILAELPEEQKQILFFKIREEQVRRFNEFDKKDGKKALKKKSTPPKTCAKRVKICEDKCGDPWTWVMGDFKGDVKAEDKWNQVSDGVSLHEVNGAKNAVEIHALPRTKAGKTTTAKKPVPAVTPHTPKPPPVAPRMANVLPTKPTPPQRRPVIPPRAPPVPSIPSPPPSIPEEAEPDEPTSVYEGMDEIMKMNEMKQKKSAEEDQWKQQLNRFKKEDERRRVMARRASMEVLRQSNVDADKIRRMVRLRMKFHKAAKTEQPKPILPPKPKNLRPKHPMQIDEMTKPATKADAINWFRETQLDSILQSNDGMFPDYLHGIISRQDANALLENHSKGDFLVRISDKIWGYALSYKDEDRVKHFLIDASAPSSYHFFGNDQIRHSTLQEVVEFHMEEAISFGNEVLKAAVGQKDNNNPDYNDVLPAGTNNSNQTTAF